jgi:hypothetical protein
VRTGKRGLIDEPVTEENRAKQAPSLGGLSHQEHTRSIAGLHRGRRREQRYPEGDRGVRRHESTVAKKTASQAPKLIGYKQSAKEKTTAARYDKSKSGELKRARAELQKRLHSVA